jgi:phospholipase C
MEPSCVPDPALDKSAYPYGGAFRATPVQRISTMFDRLDAVHRPWRIYGQPSPGNIFSICPSFARCQYTRQTDKVVPTTRVLTDAAQGKLPAYSVLTPSNSSRDFNGADTSQHNGVSMLAGDNWIGRVVAAVERGPQAASTVIFITYDDCGCFYDHVPPGRNPDGTKQGPRMPMVIVSPYAKAGFTDSTPATYASILALTEHALGLKPLSANDASAYDFRNVFDFSQRPLSAPQLSQQALPAETVNYLRSHPVDEDDPT